MGLHVIILSLNNISPTHDEQGILFFIHILSASDGNNTIKYFSLYEMSGPAKLLASFTSFNSGIDNKIMTENTLVKQLSSFIHCDKMYDYKKNKDLNIFVEVISENKAIHDEPIFLQIYSTLKKSKQLSEFSVDWITPTLNDLLKDLFQMLDKIKHKNIVLMGCLVVLYRQLFDTVNLSYSNVFDNFFWFADFIKKCMMGVHSNFWNEWLPFGWNKFFIYGCIIVDDILYGDLPFKTMHASVYWEDIPSVNTLITLTLYDQMPEKDDTMQKHCRLEHLTYATSKMTLSECEDIEEMIYNKLVYTIDSGLFTRVSPANVDDSIKEIIKKRKLYEAQDEPPGKKGRLDASTFFKEFCAEDQHMN